MGRKTATGFSPDLARATVETWQKYTQERLPTKCFSPDLARATVETGTGAFNSVARGTEFQSRLSAGNG